MSKSAVNDEEPFFKRGQIAMRAIQDDFVAQLETIAITLRYLDSEKMEPSLVTLLLTVADFLEGWAERA